MATKQLEPLKNSPVRMDGEEHHTVEVIRSIKFVEGVTGKRVVLFEVGSEQYEAASCAVAIVNTLRGGPGADEIAELPSHRESLHRLCGPIGFDPPRINLARDRVEQALEWVRGAVRAQVAAGQDITQGPGLFAMDFLAWAKAVALDESL